MRIKEFGFRFCFFAAGAAMGVVAALLTAPRTGKQTRKAISRGLEDGVDYLSHKSKAVSKRVETVLDKSKDLANRLVA